MENKENIENPDIEEKNCEILNSSWEILKKLNDDELGEQQRNTSEIIHHSEDSDGISVISESELFKTMSENETEKGEETVTTDDEKVEVADFPLPLTPPATPMTEIEENVDQEPCFINNNPRNFIFGAGLFLIVAILYSHINSLKNDIQKCDQRIQRLEEENQMLKTALDKLQKLNEPQEVLNGIEELPEIIFESPLEIPDEVLLSSLYDDEPRKPPPTKTVWLGSETEHKVQILDKKNELPDYCFYTEEDDLFFEYNQELCEQKRRKLDKKNAKENKRKLEKQQEWNEESFDKNIHESLNSLNDEIQEIKRKRMAVDEEFDENSLKNYPEKQKKSVESSGESPKISENPRKPEEKFRKPENDKKMYRKSWESFEKTGDNLRKLQEIAEKYSENTRKFQENSGKSPENTRKFQENSGKSSENTRKFQENSGKSSENSRKFQENNGNSQEKSRKIQENNSESPRKNQENMRKFQEKSEFPSNERKENSSKPKPKKQKKKDRNWLSERGIGREEARKIQEMVKENEENWYLKRKNERELDRLQS